MIQPIEGLELTSDVQSSNPIMLRNQIKQIQLEKQSQKSQSSTRKLKQKPANTIEVLSDQEQEQVISERFQEELLKAKIQEAKLTRSKYNILKVLYVELNFHNRTDGQKEHRFNSMVKVYISKNLKTSKGQPFDIRSSYFFDKMIATPDECFVQNEYLLYGCDLLPHKHIEKIFRSFTPSIKWIDASHCKLTFLSKIQGWNAVVNNCLNFQLLRKEVLDSEKVQKLMDNLELEGQRQMQEQHQSKYNEEYAKIQKFKQQFHLLKDYVDLTPYYELGFKRKLMIRNVTSKQQLIGYDLNSDTKSHKSLKSNQAPSERKHVESQFKKYLRVKDVLWNQIQNSPLVKPEYEKLERQIQREEQLLQYGKGKRIIPGNTYLNKQTQHQFSKQGYRERYQNQYERQGQNYDQHYKKSHEYNASNNSRTRSREHYAEQRFNQGGYRGRGQTFNSHLDRRVRRQDMMERVFDSYVEQRDGVNIIQNPQKYLEPQFVDRRTGLHFYRNPFYTPPIQAQPQFQPYPQSPQVYTGQPLYQHPYNEQYPIKPLSGYPYGENAPRYEEGNVNNRRAGSYHGNFNQGAGNSQLNPDGYPYNNQQRPIRNFKQKKPLNASEQQFNNYCAERTLATKKATDITPSTQKRSKGIIIPPQKQLQSRSSQILFLADDFSIITEQKTQQHPERQGKNDEDLQNILDQINEEETSVNIVTQPYTQGKLPIQQKPNDNLNDHEEDSQDLDFMLQQRGNQQIKNEVKVEIPSKRVTNEPANCIQYIEERIKEEHIPNWFNSSHDVDSYEASRHYTNVTQNAQAESKTHQNFQRSSSQVSRQSANSSTQGMRKKTFPKKKRDQTHSLKKRQNQSLTKKD